MIFGNILRHELDHGLISEHERGKMIYWMIYTKEGLSNRVTVTEGAETEGTPISSIQPMKIG